MNHDEADLLRQRLVAISDEVRALSSTDFAQKFRLSAEADDLRSQLAALSAADADTLRQWAERAGRKGAHTADDDAAAAIAAIATPIEGGGSI